MAKKDYSQDIRSLEISIPYFSIKTESLTPSDQKILSKAYGLYLKYCEALLGYEVDPRIEDVVSFQKLVKISEIGNLISKLTELNSAEQEKPKEQEASIPPELESLVAEYEKNKALLESEEIKSNSQRSVAEQVKIAIAHSKIKQKALLNKQKRQARGEKFQDADKVLISLGSPKSDSKKTALAASYAAVREVALTYESFLKLSVEAQNRIIEEAVELNSICVTNIDVAIQSASLLINISDLSAEDQKNLSKISSNFVHSVYDAVNTQTTQAATLTAQIAENEIILLKYAEEVKQNIVVDLEIKLIQIKTLTETNQKLAQKIENLPKQLDVFVDNQAVAFQEFNKDCQTRLSKDPDTLDRIELANNVFISIHSNLENNGVQPRLFSSLDDAALLEAAIRHNMPGELNAHAGYQAEMAAALVNNPKTQDPDIIHHDIPIFYGKGLTPTLLAKARLFAINNPESELGKLFKSNKELFDAAGTQIRRIANSPLGKEITKVPVVLGKFANTPIGKNINKIITGWTKLTQPVTKFFSKISDKFPVVFGNIFRIVEDPIGAVRSWVGKKVGDYVVKKILSSTAGKAAIKAGTKIATELTKKGLGKALSKLAVSIGAKFGLAATGVGAIPAIIWLVGDIILSVIKGTVNVVQKVAVSVYGEKIKTRDVLIVPVVGAVTVVAVFFSKFRTATASAASSAATTLVLGVLVGFFFYVTSIVVAPLISTLVQLESIPAVNTVTGCANTQGIFVSQRDPAWSGVFCTRCDTKGSCNIGGSGCGSASMTIILNAFGLNKSVIDIWHAQHDAGGYVYGNPTPPFGSCGTDNNNSLKMLTENGLSVTDIGTDYAEADSVLANCGLILATGGLACNAGYCGHLLVIVGHAGNQITTMDPWMGENYIHTIDSSYKPYRMWAVVP